MAPQKSQQVDSATDNGRSTMRRLSSIASLHHLLPFTKTRRSHGTVNDSTDSVSSNVSSLLDDTSNIISESNTLNTSSAHVARKSLPGNGTYAFLPDEPTGSMPRSRTFSNLPLPTRARRQQQTPATTIPLKGVAQPTSRLPTPTTSTRQHVPAQNLSKPSRYHSSQGKLKRSDTEPLLSSSNAKYPSTRLKENLPTVSKNADEAEASDLFGSSLGSSIFDSNNAYARVGAKTILPRDKSFSGKLPSKVVFDNKKLDHQASAAKSTQDPQDVHSMQRWNSQPLLARIGNRKPAKTYEIKEARLMTALRPPTPNPTLLAQSMHHNPYDQHLTTGQESEQEGPAQTSQTRNVRDVWIAEPPSYWSGRLSSLIDRLRNEELMQQGQSAEQPPRAQTDLLGGKTAKVARVRSALEQLHKHCKTEEAKESLVAFQLQYASLNNVPDLVKPMSKSSISASQFAENSEPVTSHSTATVPTTRKMSFVSRLLGRDRRGTVV